MAKIAANVFAPSTGYAVWTAPLGTALPTTAVANPGAGFYEVGYIADDGIAEGRNVNETKIYDLLGTLLRIIRNQEERPFTFTAREDNRVVRELKYPNTTVVTTGGTGEVETITISGTPTGGTFPVTLPGYGTYNAAYNVPAATLQSALQSLWGVAVTVGLASNVYTFTFPSTAGNVPQITTSGASLTGGTTPNATAATTTPGVTGSNSRAVTSGTGINQRVWYIYAADGVKVQAFAIGVGEATATGTSELNGTNVKMTQFQLQPYPDPNNSNAFFVLLDNDPAQAVSYA